jgi:diguanylate cyclase (GGDEF)-like protein
MTLDVATISLAGGIATVFSGIFLLAYWWQNRRFWSAFWWAVGHCGLGTGIILVGLHAVLPFFVSNIAAPLLLDLSAPFSFVAARVFSRGSIDRYRVAGAVAAWMALLIGSGVFASEHLAAALGVATSAGFYAAAALELLFERGEELRGRIPLIGIVTLYAIALFMLAGQFALATDFVPVATPGWLGAVQFIGLVYALAVSLFLTMMLNNRTEKKYIAEALTDPLTGLANRRAFMDRSQRMLDRQGRDRQPVSLLAFDLDRFKQINDTFGHAMGDRVLRTFAEVLVGVLRPVDLGARIGGEEFVVLALGIDSQAAVAIANRIRDAFQRTALFVEGQRIGATVSVGIAARSGEACTVTDILAEADAALYRAKNEGRNRVVLAASEPPDGGLTNVVRIA